MAESSTHYPALAQTISTNLAPLRRSQEAMMAGFGAMSKAAMADGALSEKQKELIALAISVNQRCAGCLAFHVRTLRKLGVSKAEFDEAVGVAVYMGGGPALMYAAEAQQAWDQFAPAA